MNAAAGLATLRGEADGCRRCPLYKNATQAVFGEGPPQSALMLIGEQPGDREDLAGRPFVGPAGGILDRALADAGWERQAVYVTNAVKHFKFRMQGKRRLHQKPNAHEIERCRWWLDRERVLVEPRLMLALGVTAARALLGRTVTISRMRGQVVDLTDPAGSLMVTVHPSYLLRIRDGDDRKREYGRFVADLRAARTWLDAIRPTTGPARRG
jgi:DNA polymerase